MVNRGSLLAILAATALLFCGVAVAEEDDDALGGQAMIPAGLHSPASASDQAWDMRAIARTAGPVVRTVTGQAASGSPQPAWENVGPTGWGRIWDIKVDPLNDSIVYMSGSSGGGVWKSVNQGTSWQNIFHNAKSQSIGDIEIDPSNRNTIWVGTGECLAGGGSIPYPGCGIYKSTDAGTTFQFKGLGGDSSLYISRVSIHPTNPNIVFAGAMGSLFNHDPAGTIKRGVYRTKDGGATWQLVLKVNDSTGCTDVLVHPTNPARVIACMWTAMRYPYARQWSSPDCRVWHSEDTGTTWTLYGAADGLPTTDLNRSTLTISKSNPNIIYLIYFGGSGPSSAIKGVWRSQNAGVSWTQTTGTPPASIYSYYGHTFAQIRCNPANPNDVIALGMTCVRSQDGGASWTACFPSTHLDFHAVCWSNQNQNLIFTGDDGGLGKWTAGPSGSFTYVGRTALASGGFAPGGFAIGQIYSLDVARDNANYRYIGQQDEGTNYCTNGANTYADWNHNAIGGDGFTVRVDPGNCNYVIGCLQYGGYYLSTNRTSFSSFSISGTRKQWKCPVAFDSISGRAYTGSELVNMASRGSTSFTSISTDLTNGNHNATSNYPYGTVSSLAAYNGVCYAGTDDGNVWVSKNATGTSATWTKIRNGLLHTDPLPWTGAQEVTDADGWISDVSIDQSKTDGSAAYVTIWYFRWGRNYYKPRIYQLSNWGLGGVGSADWKDISGDLPPAITTTKVVKDNSPDRPGWLYCSTDWGMYYSTNGGTNWGWMGDTTLPLVVCNDICLHRDTLFVGTYGQSALRLNLVNLPPRQPVGVAIPTLVSKGNQTLSSFPNPVINRTTIRFTVRDRQKVSVGIYDISGRLTRQLLNGEVEGGRIQQVAWDRTSSGGGRVAPGAYICRVIGDKITLAMKIVVR